MFHTLRAKLIGQTIISLTILLLLGLVVFIGFEKLQTNSQAITENGELLRDQMTADMMHDAIRGDVLSALRAAAANSGKPDQEKMDTARKDLGEHIDNFETALKAMRAMPLTATLKKQTDAVQPALHQYVMAARALFSHVENKKDGEQDFEHFMETFGVVEEKMGELSDQITAYSQQIQATSNKEKKQTYWILGISLSAAILLLLVVARLIFTSVFHTLGAEPLVVAEHLQQISMGNLKQEIEIDQQHHESVLAHLADMQRTLRQFVEAQLDMAAAHDAGQISHRINASQFIGAYAEMAQNANSMVQSHIAMNDRFVDLMVQYAGGHFAEEMASLPGEKQKVSDTAETLRALLLQAQADAQETRKIKIALDNASACIMMADNEGVIRYQNLAAQKLMQDAQTSIRRRISDFDAAQLMNTSIYRFYPTSQQQQRLHSLQSPYVEQLELGNQHFRLAASPINDSQGKRLGTVFEWVDRTNEIHAENEIAAVVEAASKGNFGQRVNEAGKSGFFLQMTQGMNRILNTSESGLSEIARILGAMAHGDLTQTIETEFEGVFGQLKEDSNGTIYQLATIIRQIREATQAMNLAAREIAMGNADLSQRTEEQASSLAMAASSMEELTATVQQNAENAKQANQLADSASKIAIQGGEVMDKVVATMGGITESSRKISDIITVIDGIAFQTNILALNAAVEAARAGEQGRGFAVVASEVRNLAQRSANAAKEIKHLISDSVVRVDEGSKLIETAGITMDEIVQSVKRVTNIMADISTASHEQSDGIRKVNESVNEMDKVTQQNAALVEEAAAAAESLEEQASNLTRAVAVFRLDGHDLCASQDDVLLDKVA